MSVNVVLADVKELQSKKTGKPYVLLTASDGAIFSVWPDKENIKLFNEARALKPGASVVLSYEQNGDYKNVSQIVVSSEPEEKSAARPFFNDRKDRRISRLACINASIEYHRIIASITNQEPLEKSILEVAEKLEQWVYRGMEE